ncbi:hypothetical protein IRP63_04985 [Clostridium botulinum]|uniref:Peptidase S1 domain-containing protein n=1 Tax=Clostridium botulinum C/D str. DC5 TaxID=1443128 RepID=A0A0A0IH11_CLOBO|nr:hypothetical protein [Clostridium botulinum]KGM94385.1 hypothetical protein Z956_07655 [Clostridium botulinum D str. CCUG 7971]KGN00248.1 hypothetical protein Z955_04455 [Clostridium botulinum C/D str. DC5]KOC50186.1 hypothetical protein ADU89_14800 [Clostridium botulinum]KOC50642.1 hypothetical protein ADU88_01845 [Clostridium botulinum]KOC57646.1 hypothetical protein ADU90_04495 [Clostridium botulinum]
MNNCCILEDKIKCICNCDYKFFLNKPNVTGIGLGYKERGGFCIPKMCINVFVTNKVPENELLPQDRIPRLFKGIDTDVIVSGMSEILSLTHKIRPVPGGYNIGSTKKNFQGTMGCIVTDGRDWHILSCCHIIAQYGSATLGTPVLQPSLEFGGRIGHEEIAYLSKYIPFKPITPTTHPENRVDCAMAEVHNRSLVTNKIALVGGIKGIGHPALGQNVQKVGENSERTTGKIKSLSVTTIITYPFGECLFKNQIRTSAMAKPGDSGSILLDTHMNALGLCMSGTTSETFFNPIQDVLSALDVQIVFG